MTTIKLPDLSAAVPGLLAGLPTAAAIMAAGVVLNFIIRRALLLLARRTSLTEQEVLPIHRVIRWLIVAVCGILILGGFGLNIGGFWGIVSTILAMVAIGFVAVWSVLSNTLCTVIIMLFRPFSVGDEVEFVGEPVKGRVNDLNFVYTTLDAGDGSVMQVPNNLFFQKVIRRRHGSQTIAPAVHLRTKRPAGAAGESLPAA
ncbi:MAG TPA: mechanosensitive ion channel domain-containing protein [Opitutaceae bacterium]|nr:mechanosensitive ion channel domain-containing protein [Opitutaceae bacterium]